jgi:transposase
MVTYAAIDLHSNNGVLAIIDDTDRVLRQKKLPNRLTVFLDELEPYRTSLVGVAVESTFNWYWLVDGLIKNGYEAKLVNTSAIQQYSGLKHSDDEYDAWWLAHMMRLGILPTGHIYPRDERAVRDLLRKRTTLVQQRTSNILSIQNLEQRNRATRISTKEARALTAEKLDAIYDNEDLALAITSTVSVIDALDEQIKLLERRVLKKARLRKEFELVQTIWGIGQILGLTIMYEAGSMERFRTVGDFASYCRCVDDQAVLERQDEVREQREERQRVPRLGVSRSGPLRGALLPRCEALLRQEGSEDEADRRDPRRGPQACPRCVSRPQRTGAVRRETNIPVTSTLIDAVSQKTWGWKSSHQV